MGYDNNKEDNLVQYDTDDLIYNRFDLIYRDECECFCYYFEDRTYAVYAHYEAKRAVLNTWGKRFPQHIFEQVINDIFHKHPGIRYIEFNRTGNDYHHLLEQKNDIRIPIPETAEALMKRLKSKHRYNLKRAKRLIEERYGSLTTMVYKAEIPYGLVNMYFKWKKETHGTSYGMSPEEYLKNYHVTHAILLKAGEQCIGIAFYCVQGRIVYLENFSYEKELEKYSAGYLTYVMLLQELVRERCSFLYLGGGEYTYKRHFGAEESLVYSGVVYSNNVFEELNLYFLKESIRKIAIYGLGACGKEFLKIKDRLAPEVMYGIDRERRTIEKLPVYTLEEELAEVDVVIITLYTHNEEVEVFLRTRFMRFFYWIDFARFDCKGIEYESKT